MRNHKRKNDVTVLKSAFPDFFRGEMLDLFKIPSDRKNHPRWIVESDIDPNFFGPSLTDTDVGKKYRSYIFEKYREMFDLENMLHPNYKEAKFAGGEPVYWGDFILEFPPGKRLHRHTDDFPEWNRELRFNCLLQSPEDGGVYTINGKRYFLEEGDIIVFSPNFNTHSTTRVRGKKSRIIASLSFLTKYFEDL